MIKKTILSMFKIGNVIAQSTKMGHIESTNEAKSYAPLGGCNIFNFGQTHTSLPRSLAINYYTKVQPVSSSINKIVSEIVSIDPIVFNEKTGQIIEKHPVLDLLDEPNPFCKYSEFMTNIAVDFEVTGNAFIVATGNINNPPKELVYINSTCADVQLNSDGFVDKITVNHGSLDSTTFRLRIFNRNGSRVGRYLAGNDKEIFFIKNPNPYGNYNSPYGFSNLTPIQNEMELYLHSNIHNLSSLTKGGRPSMIVKPRENLTDEQYTEFMESIQSSIAGSSNAGAITVPSIPCNIEQMSVSNKDMDFENLRKATVSSIHTQLGVPLPMVMAEQMTLANMGAANAQFYNNTIIPLANRLFCEITDMLMPRYIGHDSLVITYDRRSIPALEAESVENVKRRASLNVMTDNEIRTEIGLEHVDGADAIYKPTNQIPVARVSATANKDDFVSGEEAIKSIKRKMLSLARPDGSRIFKENQ